MGCGTFLPENICTKINKMPEFTWYLPENTFFAILGAGEWANASCLPRLLRPYGSEQDVDTELKLRVFRAWTLNLLFTSVACLLVCCRLKLRCVSLYTQETRISRSTSMHVLGGPNAWNSTEFVNQLNNSAPCMYLLFWVYIHVSIICEFVRSGFGSRTFAVAALTIWNLWLFTV